MSNLKKNKKNIKNQEKFEYLQIEIPIINQNIKEKEIKEEKYDPYVDHTVNDNNIINIL